MVNCGGRWMHKHNFVYTLYNYKYIQFELNQREERSFLNLLALKSTRHIDFCKKATVQYLVGTGLLW